MGMDLYKYKTSVDNDTMVIGLHQLDKAKEILEGTSLEYTLENIYDLDQVFKKFTGEKYNEHKHFYDLSANSKKYIAVLNEDIYIKIYDLRNKLRKTKDDDKYFELLDKIENLESTAKEKELFDLTYIEDQDIENFVKYQVYNVKVKRIELNYIRKPFRYRSTPSKTVIDENGQRGTVMYIDNTTGVDEELYEEMKKHCYIDTDNNSHMIFTSKTTKANELLQKCINPELMEDCEYLFPIKNDQIIEIDW